MRLVYRVTSQKYYNEDSSNLTEYTESQQILRLNCTWKVKGKQILHHFRVSTQVFYTNEIV